jgi:hypothetical protein
MDFNVIDSVINAVFFYKKTVSGVVSDASGLYLVQMYQSKAVQEVHRDLEGRYSIKAKTGDVIN